MRQLTKTIIISALALSLASCGNYDYEREDGWLSICLDVDQPASRAAMSADELCGTALINIYYADYSGLVRSYVNNDKPETIWLPSNDYRVDVIAGEASKSHPAFASWDQKSYKGSANFSIVPGRNTSIQVTAKVSNAIAKVTFAKAVAENFAEGYRLTLGVEDNSLVYDSSKDGAEGYFLLTGIDEPAFSWTFEGRTKDGTEFTKSGLIPDIKGGTLYSMTMGYTVTDGSLSFGLSVDSSTEDFNDLIVFEPVSSGLSPSPYYDIWAGHAKVYADLDETEFPDLSAIRFEYSANGSDWAAAVAERISEGSYRGVLTNLSPTTEYIYRLMAGDVQIGDPLTLVTSEAPAVPNGSFEESSTSSSGNFKEFYASGQKPWWGSGNGSDGIQGSADFGGFIICKPDTGEKVDGEQSACLISQWALVKFAAGNLFSGYFGGLIGTKGGKVFFGRPFTGRPTALKVYVKYSAGTIDHVDGVPAGVSIKSGSTYDTGRIQIALGQWNYKEYGGNKDCPILINTTDVSTFVDYGTDSATLAYGDLQLTSDASNSHNGWKEYIIPIEYRDEINMPTHIVISCASSMYGDYFTGCSSSKMWIDKMELVYE